MNLSSVRLRIAVVGVVFALCLSPITNGQTHPIQRDCNGVLAHIGNEDIRLDPWLPSVVRVRIALSNQLSDELGPAVIGQRDPGTWSVEERPRKVTLKTSQLSARIDMKTGAIEFKDNHGAELLRETPPFHTLLPAPDPTRDGLVPTEIFMRREDDRFFGIGDVHEGELNAPNSRIELVNRNTQIRIPMLYSNHGYGILWNNPAHSLLVLAPKSITWSSAAGNQIDFFVMAGPSADRIIAAYRMLTGQVPLLPRWAYGLWFSRNRFHSQDEILGVARAFEDHRFPLDALLQDYFYWAPTGAPRSGINWGSHKFASDRYPDPKDMITDLHMLYSVHFLPVVWPKFNPETTNGSELEKAGALFPPSHDWAGTEMRYYDPFVSKFRTMYGKQLKQRLFSLGVDGLWLDGSEPEIDPHLFQTFDSPIGPVSRVASAFPLFHTAAAYQAMREAEPDKRVVLLPRSAWAGEQRNAAVLWTGDINQDWAAFQWQLSGLQNLSITGFPYITTDIGGYSPRPENDAEQFVRWYEWGAFCPIFRVHGLERGLPWQYGQNAESILRQYDVFRHHLIPYIYSEANQITNDAGTLMRPLVMDFRTDSRAVTTTDEYMFGHAFLVAPITRSRYSELPLAPKQWSDAESKPASISMRILGSLDDTSIPMPKNLDLTAIHGVEQDIALGKSSDPILIFHGAFTPSFSGSILLRFITRSAGSTVVVNEHKYEQPSDYEYLTVPVSAQRNVPIQFTLTTKYPNPSFRVLHDDFPSGKVTRSIYLPHGSKWYDFWSGIEVRGSMLSTDADLSRLPLYIRAGSIVPFSMSDSTQETSSLFELRVYRGQNGKFSLYEDQGDGYGYQSGEYTTIPITWNEKKQTLTFGARKGSYRGMLERHVFHVVWVDEHHGAGMQDSSSYDEEVTYEGSEVHIRVHRYK